MQKYKTVEEFLEALEPAKLQQVDLLREIIHKTEPTLIEHIKWNAPSYVLNDEDRITFNLINKQGIVKLVLHMGATRVENKKATPVMNDESGIIEWNSDIRGTISFTSMDDIITKASSLKTIIQSWLSLPSR